MNYFMIIKIMLKHLTPFIVKLKLQKLQNDGNCEVNNLQNG